MKQFKKYLISFGSILLSFAILTFLLTILYYFDFISTNTFQVFKMAIFVITLIFYSILLGRSAIKNGYLDGIKLGVLLILFSFIVCLSTNSISIHFILYHTILLSCTTLGGMIGINTKKKKS